MLRNPGDRCRRFHAPGPRRRPVPQAQGGETLELGSGVSTTGMFRRRHPSAPGLSQSRAFVYCSEGGRDSTHFVFCGSSSRKVSMVSKCLAKVRVVCAGCRRSFVSRSVTQGLRPAKAHEKPWRLGAFRRQRSASDVPERVPLGFKFKVSERRANFSCPSDNQWAGWRIPFSSRCAPGFIM